jgi:hypothetical protein
MNYLVSKEFLPFTITEPLQGSQRRDYFSFWIETLSTKTGLSILAAMGFDSIAR